MRSKTMFIVIGIVLGLLLAAAGIVVAGSLNPSAPPRPARHHHTPWRTSTTG